ncbi:hypothetical protein GCM10009803_29240 [Microbacterium ginsengiterrae]
MPANRVDAGASVFGFGNDLDIAIVFGQGAQARAHEFLVIDEYKTDHGNLAGIMASTVNPS